jgi:hypothetical protein
MFYSLDFFFVIIFILSLFSFFVCFFQLKDCVVQVASDVQKF